MGDFGDDRTQHRRSSQDDQRARLTQHSTVVAGVNLRGLSAPFFNRVSGF